MHNGSLDPSKCTCRIALRIIRRKTYPRPSLAGKTPSAIKTTWNANDQQLLYGEHCIFRQDLWKSLQPMRALNSSLYLYRNYHDFLEAAPMRSNPMPVSIDCISRAFIEPSSNCSFCMNTIFQISIKRSPSSSGEPGGPPQICSP